MHGVIILDGTNTDNRQQTLRSHIIRPLAPFGLHDVCVKHNIPSTVINYASFWNAQELFDTLALWCEKNRLERITVACSTLFNVNVLDSNSNISSFITLLKQEYNVTLLVGGPINLVDYDLNGHIPDAVFQGRSLHLFEQWLIGNDPIEHKDNVNGVTRYYNATNQVVENPIVPTLHDDYCLTNKDVLQFEVRLGCKFNCTFCTFEFRNAKKTNDTDSACLYNFFETANTKYGITRFSTVDDTFNEDDSKIDTLLNAINKLDYKPKIVGYNRFDIMLRKQEQADKLYRAGFVGHYFGIETLHPEASKIIRKRAPRQEALDYLEYLTQTYPSWHMCSGYIVGIPGEPKEHIIDVFSEIQARKAIQAMIPVDLGLYNIPGNEDNYSDFSKEPEKYGITITGGDPSDLDWSHDLFTKREAKQLAKRLASKNIKHGITTIDPWEAISRDALGLVDLFDQTQKAEYSRMLSEHPSEMYSAIWLALGDQHIGNYIVRKKQYINSL
jgi:lipoate synthase